MMSRYSWSALCVFVTACAAGPVPAPDAGAPLDDGSATEPRDGGGPDLPDVGPPSCPDPDPWYRDLDGDGHGDPGVTVESCDSVEGFVEIADDCDDDCAACSPSAPEVCDARDNDCDAMTDETFPCTPGGEVACVTSCGTAGTGACTSSCGAPSGEACAPPAELCNGDDDDCDGRVDETFPCAAGSTSTCTSACGTTGTGTCTSACEPAPPAACTPPAESCNGTDDDCDGAPDDDFTCVLSATVACTTSCGTTGSGECTSACGIPSGVACVPPPEICNGLDEDCDGAPDDGFECVRGRPASCTTSCGSTGTGTCSAWCTRAGASSCTPPAEACTGADEDCDGLVDEQMMRGGPALIIPQPYDYYRPRVARGATKLYAIWSLAGRNWLWRLNDDGTVDRSGVALETASQYDIASNPSGRVVYAWIDGGGDVNVHLLEDAPSYGALYRWSRRISTDAVEVHVAVGSTRVWVYTRNAVGRVEFHTLDILTGAVEGAATYVATSPTRIAVTSNGYREHTVALHVTDFIFWFRYDLFDGREASGVFSIDRTRLREIAVAGDYDYAPIRQNGLLIAYALTAGGGQSAELRYYSWRMDGTTTDQRITTGTVADAPWFPQLDLEMADGIADLAAVWTSSSTSLTGSPRVYQLARNATGAGYSVTPITFSLPSERHDGVSVIRFPDSAGMVSDRMFYDPTSNAIASVPIGCY